MGVGTSLKRPIVTSGNFLSQVEWGEEGALWDTLCEHLEDDYHVR